MQCRRSHWNHLWLLDAFGVCLIPKGSQPFQSRNFGGSSGESQGRDGRRGVQDCVAWGTRDMTLIAGLRHVTKKSFALRLPFAALTFKRFTALLAFFRALSFFATGRVRNKITTQMSAQQFSERFGGYHVSPLRISQILLSHAGSRSAGRAARAVARCWRPCAMEGPSEATGLPDCQWEFVAGMTVRHPW